MRFAAILLAALAIPDVCPAQFRRVASRPAAGRIAGAALRTAPRGIVTWGDRVSLWPEALAEPQPLPVAGPFAEGGCLADLDRDGLPDLVLQETAEPHALVWFQAPAWNRHVIDTHVDMHDCREATLLGHRGLLIVQRYAQVRLYERPEPPADRWPYREIYSFYTPSRQAGLLLSDVDGDSRPDIFCGNYWIRSPASFELPWRLFAINVYNETPDSATMRLALWGRDLVVAQGHLEGARVTRFRKPANPELQWEPHPIGETLGIHKPHGLAVVGGRLIVAENSGDGSRLMVFARGSDAKPVQVETSRSVHTILPCHDGFIAVGDTWIERWATSAGTRRRPGSSPPGAAKTHPLPWSPRALPPRAAPATE